MKRNSAYVVHVTMCYEHGGLSNSTVGAPSYIKGDLDLWQNHTRFLHHPTDAGDHKLLRHAIQLMRGPEVRMQVRIMRTRGGRRILLELSTAVVVIIAYLTCHGNPFHIPTGQIDRISASHSLCHRLHAGPSRTTARARANHS